MINFVYYTEKNMTKTLNDFKKVERLLKKKTFLWIDVLDPTKDDIAFLSETFNFHPLTLEDIINRKQRPKIENYDDYIFMVFRPIESGKTKSIELDILIGKNYIVTARRKRLDSVEHVKDLVEKGGLLDKGADVIAYHIIDRAVDSYFPVLDNIENRIDIIEEKIIKNLRKEIADDIYRLRKTAFLLRKLIASHREVIGKLLRRNTPFIRARTLVFFRDIYDHCFRQNDMIDTHRELLSSARENYLSQMSNNLNETMQTLTSIATITLPLVVIAGIYGMNFQYMPELQWRYGYFVILVIMFVIVAIMLYYFRRKNWI